MILSGYLTPERILFNKEKSFEPFIENLLGLFLPEEQESIKTKWKRDTLKTYHRYELYFSLPSYSLIHIPINLTQEGVLFFPVPIPGLTQAKAVLGISKHPLQVQHAQIHVAVIMLLPEEKTSFELQILEASLSLLSTSKLELFELSLGEKVLALLEKNEDALKPSFTNLTKAELVRELETDLEKGLSLEEAQERQKKFGFNEVAKKKKKSWVLRLVENLFSFFAILLWLAAGLCFIPGVDMPQLGFAIVIVVLINGLFSFLQEFKSDKAVEALSKMMARSSRVIRGNAPIEIPAADLVPGDLILLEEGDIVPADVRILEAFEVEVDNSSLTGEPIATKRYASDERQLLAGKFLWLELPNILFAGSVLAKGNAKAVVYATGTNTEIGKIADLTFNIKAELSPLQKQLKSTVYSISLLALGIGLTFLFLGWFIAGLTFVQAFVFFIGLFVANVPEGLLPTVTLSLAMGVTRMAKRNAIVKNLSSVETLGCTTVICTDKTGTLTQNLMMVSRVVLPDREILVSGHGYDVVGEWREAEKILEVASLQKDMRLTYLLSCAQFCNNAHLEVMTLGGTKALGDPTEACLLTLCARAQFKQGATRLGQNSFDSKRKRMSVVVETESHQKIIYAKGAPVEMLDCCDSILETTGARKLQETDRQKIIEAVDRLASEGFRVLAFAYRTGELELDPTLVTIDSIEKNLIYLGLVAISDPVRSSVPEAVKSCHTAGIRIIMITGDYALTAKSIGKQIGLSSGTEPVVITGTELNSIPDTHLKIILNTGEPIFARVSPEQKLRIVTLLKENGEIVAVTGDGVNDGPALKKADIGIAMGLRGTDVAKEAAQMILTDDNFSSIVTAIEEGRAIFENIKRFSAYVLNSNPQEMYPFMLWMLIPGYPLAMTVMGVLAVDVGTDLIPAMGLGIEPPERGIMEKPPRKQKEKLLSMGFILRAYLIQGSILALCCFATYYYFAWSVGLMAHGFSWLSLPPSPDKLDMSKATPLYLQSLAAFFFTTVTVQMANVLCKRTSKASLFSRAYLNESARTGALEKLSHLTLFEPLNTLTKPFFRCLSKVFEKLPILFNFFSNPLVTLGIAFELILCVLFFTTDLRHVYYFAPLPWDVVLFAFHGFFVMLGFEETKKYFRRRGHALEFLG